MSRDRLPIGVVIPTLNVRRALPEHVAQMQTWLDRVEEVIVVDSQSTDGTVEFLKANMHHPRFTVLCHPPGLWQSWNEGIQHVSARFAYISTIGDTITDEGLQHLLTVAEEQRAEIVISRPLFVDERGNTIPGERWPIHKLLERCPISRPERLPAWQVLLLNALDAPQGMMGSSASNLYSTWALQRVPFPLEYGHAGDSAWGLMTSLSTSMVVTPQIFSRFVMHPNANTGLNAGKALALLRRFHALCLEMFEKARADTSISAAARDVITRFWTLLRFKFDADELRESYYAARREFTPWFLNPGAWRARSARKQHWRRLPDIAREMNRPAQAQDDVLNAGSSFAGAVNQYLWERAAELLGEHARCLDPACGWHHQKDLRAESNNPSRETASSDRERAQV